MREYSKEVDLDEFLAHLDTGLEAVEYETHFGHYGPQRPIGDFDPSPAIPTGLDALEAELMEEEPLC